MSELHGDLSFSSELKRTCLLKRLSIVNIHIHYSLRILEFVKKGNSFSKNIFGFLNEVGSGSETNETEAIFCEISSFSKKELKV